MDNNLYHNKVIVCFYRKQPGLSPEDVRFLYIKQCEETGEYAVKMKTNENKAILYTKTMFLTHALSNLTLLMAEFGVGSQWDVLK